MYYDKPYQDQHSRRQNKTWIIPDEQVQKFLNEPINYRQLFIDCLQASEQTKPIKKLKHK